MLSAFIFYSGKAPPGKLAGVLCNIDRKVFVLSGTNTVLLTEPFFPELPAKRGR